ncbi:MAG: FAD-binding oxidoreductase, partial [Eubacteriales bacterium]|nr:FAD-binding oxidoreductase [Eubacteriales bacterium]
AGMDRILEFDETNFTVTVEPGVLLMTLQEECAARGMMYPPDPGEKSATIGGNVMTNAGGMRAIKYGVTRDYVLGMTIVLPDGTITDVGGKIVRNSSGYSIKDLLIGSEGTLAIVTKIILKLIPMPAYSLSLLVPFNDLDQCFNAVPEILKARTFPTAVEFMQRQVIEAAEEYLGLKFPDKSANAYLLLTFDGSSSKELEETYRKAADVCLVCGAEDVYISDTEERQTSIWKARGAFLEAIKTSTSEMDECDVVIPRGVLSDFMTQVDKLEKESGLRLRSFGHAGDGNLHIYLCKDSLDEKSWNEKCGKVMGALYSYADMIGGQISGEHGIGHAKIDYLEESVGSRLMEIMSGIKRSFDPDGILNPGKVCR